MVSEIPQAISRGVWACLESGKHVTLDRIQEATSFPHMATLPYLNALLADGYVKISGITTAVGGETICLFELRLRTGPLAPYVNENGNLIDPNRIDLRPKRPRTLGPEPEGPNLPARLRFAAERFRLPFTRAELADMAGITTEELPAFQRAMPNLRPELTALQDDRFLYHPIPHSDRERLRNLLKSNTGRWVGIAEIREFMKGKRGYGQSLRGARHLLLAEGYSVEAVFTRQKNCRYRVTPPHAGRNPLSPGPMPD